MIFHVFVRIFFSFFFFALKMSTKAYDKNIYAILFENY